MLELSWFDLSHTYLYTTTTSPDLGVQIKSYGSTINLKIPKTLDSTVYRMNLRQKTDLTLINTRSTKSSERLLVTDGQTVKRPQSALS